MKIIPNGIREIYLRADSGFYDADFMDYLEQKGIRYTIVVKPYPWIQIQLVGLNYRAIGGGVSIGEMWYRWIGWIEPRRMIVIREKGPKESRNSLHSLSLWGTIIRLSLLILMRCHLRKHGGSIMGELTLST